MRRTIPAILWRHRNGAQWRSLPSELGPWWLAAQLFIRWAKRGVWERLLDRAQQRDIALGMAFIDGTKIRAHPEAAGAEKAGRQPAARCARGAWPLSRQLWHKSLRDRRRARTRHRLRAHPGQAHELPLAPGLLGRLPDVPGWIVGDRGFAADAFRERIRTRGARPAIPPKRRDAPVACPVWIYANRHRVENLRARLKEWRAVATRYEKTAPSFLGVLCLAATADWLK